MLDDQSLSELVDELGMDAEDLADGDFGIPSSNTDLVSAVTSEEGAKVAHRPSASVPRPTASVRSSRR